MKSKFFKRILSLIFSFVLLSSNVALAHPGGIDGNGGHFCRTNCSYWGLQTGEYHYHNNDGSYTNSKGDVYAKDGSYLYYNNGVRSIVLKGSDGKLLSGVGYQLFDSNKNLIRLSRISTGQFKVKSDGGSTIAFTGADGKTTISGIKSGKYYIKQYNTKEGYVKDLRYLDIYVGKTHVTSTLFNQKTQLEGKRSIILKGSDGKLLTGIGYQLFDANKNLIRLSRISTANYKVNPSGGSTIAFNGADAKTTITGIKPGKYYIKQYNTKPGYIKDLRYLDIYIGQTHVTSTLYNKVEPLTGSRSIVLKGSDGKLLTGIGYQLFDANKNLIRLSRISTANYKVNPSGGSTIAFNGLDAKTTISGIEPGKYYIKQYNTKPGYVKDLRYMDIYVSTSHRTSILYNEIQK